MRRRTCMHAQMQTQRMNGAICVVYMHYRHRRTMHVLYTCGDQKYQVVLKKICRFSDSVGKNRQLCGTEYFTALISKYILVQIGGFFIPPYRVVYWLEIHCRHQYTSVHATPSDTHRERNRHTHTWMREWSNCDILFSCVFNDANLCMERERERVCVCVCSCVWVCFNLCGARVHICTHTRTHTYTYIHSRTCTRTQTHTKTHTSNSHTHMHTHANTHKNTHKHVY